ncbi:hypothetical protein H8D36_04405 [archaeon]|nr:hypothetical protein [archaeon]MBL7057503.1 hypothetical protein [Candidatus Woesearchaeota archaeon]
MSTMGIVEGVIGIILVTLFAYLVITKLLPIVKKLLERFAGVKEISDPLIAFVKLLIVVTALVPIIGYLSTIGIPYIDMIEGPIHILESLLGDITWLIYMAILIFIGLTIYRKTSQKTQ